MQLCVQIVQHRTQAYIIYTPLIIKGVQLFCDNLSKCIGLNQVRYLFYMSIFYIGLSGVCRLNMTALIRQKQTIKAQKSFKK